MINLDGFLNGYIVYHVSAEDRVDFLTNIENITDILWFNGAKPTEFIPPTGKIEDEFNTCICINRNWCNEKCLVYGDLEFLKDRNVEVY